MVVNFMDKKIALVTGSAGQDGSYLCELLIRKKYKVVAADRRSSRDNGWRHKELRINEKLIYEDFDLTDINSIISLFQKYKFKEVYNLAAQSFVGSSFSTPISTSNVTGLGPLRILETIKNFSPKTKFYQASSSEMFGKVYTKILNEKTRFNPRSPYAVSKLFGHEITKNYRESYGLFCCSGILFNHESPRRGFNFVTRKITLELGKIMREEKEYMELGNLDSKRDWGHSKDYVEAMWLMLQKDTPKDYVIGTGKQYSIRDFVEKSFKVVNKEIVWEGTGLEEVGKFKDTNQVVVRVNPKYYRPCEVDTLLSDPKKAMIELKWKPEISFEQLVEDMVKNDL